MIPWAALMRLVQLVEAARWVYDMCSKGYANITRKEKRDDPAPKD